VPSGKHRLTAHKGGFDVKLRSFRITVSASLVAIVWTALAAVAALAGSETPPLPR
jgi:hypothetical protein